MDEDIASCEQNKTAASKANIIDATKAMPTSHQEQFKDTSEVEAGKKKDEQSSPASTVTGGESALNATPSQSLPSIDHSIITLTDGEEDEASPVAHPSIKVKLGRQRRSMGEASSAGCFDEDRMPLKMRKINVAGAPKMPLTGYVRYMNERREALRREQPHKTAMEHTKLIGEEWQQMSEDLRAPYMKAAQNDKQRYVEKLHVFLKTRPDVLASELAKKKPRRNTSEGKSVSKEKPQSHATGGNAKSGKDGSKEKMSGKNIITTSSVGTTAFDEKIILPSLPLLPLSILQQQQLLPPIEKQEKQLKRTPTPTFPTTALHATPTNSSSNNGNSSNYGNSSNNGNSSTSTISSSGQSTTMLVTPVPGEIPIFTNEFLEHNKTFDMELRTLRKSKTDLEQQNAVLEKHVENMKFGVQKMTHENEELQEKNRLLEIYLEKLKHKLANALAGLAIPTEPNGATFANIDKYMHDLHKMSTSNTHGPACLNKAKDIIRKLDLQIQL